MTAPTARYPELITDVTLLTLITSMADEVPIALRSTVTGTTFRYRLHTIDEAGGLRVELLPGDDNPKTAGYIGIIFDGPGFVRSPSSPVAPLAPPVVAFAWFHAWLRRGKIGKGLEVWA